ncbi:MAG: hypothetical protein GXO10_03295 [Crenarchaeota archaeon]|nr:hypothetical protein [Thermoproteota archaeon]
MLDRAISRIVCNFKVNDNVYLVTDNRYIYWCRLDKSTLSEIVQHLLTFIHRDPRLFAIDQCRRFMTRESKREFYASSGDMVTIAINNYQVLNYRVNTFSRIEVMINRALDIDFFKDHTQVSSVCRNLENDNVLSYSTCIDFLKTIPRLWYLLNRDYSSSMIIIPFHQFIQHVLFSDIIPTLFCLLHDFVNNIDNNPRIVLIPRLYVNNRSTRHMFDYALASEGGVIIVDVKYLLGPRENSSNLERFGKLFEICLDKVKNFICKVVEWSLLYPCREFDFVLKIVSFNSDIMNDIKRTCSEMLNNLTLQVKKEAGFTGITRLEVVYLQDLARSLRVYES